MNKGLAFSATNNSNKTFLEYKVSSDEVCENTNNASNPESEEKKREPGEATPTKPKTTSLQPADQNRTTYFWGPSECAEFIKRLHEYGKRWIIISGVLKNRDQLQCRSHGQKYMQSLRDLA